MRIGIFGIGLSVVLIVWFAGISDVSSSGLKQGGQSLDALVADVAADNLTQDNITFWQDEILGDEALAELMLAVPIGAVFPDITLYDLDGSSATISTNNTAHLINFWATWCEPCRMELPLLIAAHHDPNAPFEVVFANVWDDAAAYASFVAESLPEDALAGIYEDTARQAIGLEAVPVTVLLDEAHVVQVVHVGNVTDRVMAFLYAVASKSDGVVLPGVDLNAVPSIAVTPADSDNRMQSLARANRESGSTTLWVGGEVGVEGTHFHGVEVGEKFPAFGFMTTMGNPLLLDKLDGPVLLNFWASWCGPCVDEFPLLIDAHNTTEAAFEVVFVNIWDDPYTFEAFLADYPEDLVVGRDVVGEMPDLYGIEFIPMSFLLDANGAVLLIQYGPVNEDAMAFMTQLLD